MKTFQLRLLLRVRTVLVLCMALIAATSASPISVRAQDYSDKVERAASEVSMALERSHVRGVSVLDFTDLQGAPTELGRLLAEEVSDKLVSLGTSYAVVDRQNLNLLLKEHNLSQDGLIDPKTRRQLGNLIGIDTVIVGTAVPLGNQIRLSVRAVSIETGRILIASSVQFFTSPEFEHLNDRGVSDQSGTSETAATSPRGTGSIRLTPDLNLEISSLAARNRAIVATLTFHNRGNHQIILALNGSRAFCADFQLSDGRGGFCEACANGEVLSSLPVSIPGSILFSQKNWAQIAPMSTAQHVLNFHSGRCSSPISGRDGLSLNGSLLVDDGSGISRVPVSFTNMQLFVPEQR